MRYTNTLNYRICVVHLRKDFFFARSPALHVECNTCVPLFFIEGFHGPDFSFILINSFVMCIAGMDKMLLPFGDMVKRRLVRHRQNYLAKQCPYTHTNFSR